MHKGKKPLKAEKQREAVAFKGVQVRRKRTDLVIKRFNEMLKASGTSKKAVEALRKRIDFAYSLTGPEDGSELLSQQAWGNVS